MRSRSRHVSESLIERAIESAWALKIDALRYVPEGGGAHHWVAQGTDGRRWFVTCDDLDTKPWLGSDRASVFEALEDAYAVAMALRAGGLGFVAAPTPTTSGSPAERIDARHSVSVFDYIEGTPGSWGQPLTDATTAELLSMLAQLHGSATLRSATAQLEFAVPGRERLEVALDDLGRPWEGGPFSELARRELADHVDRVTGWLDALDRLGTRSAKGGEHVVLTHGEPHPGNLIRTGAGLVLVDWDTVAGARPERDVWMLAHADPSNVAHYEQLTGMALDLEVLAGYRLLWALADVAAFTARLRSEHHADADASWALDGLRKILREDEPAPYRPPARLIGHRRCSR